MEILTQPAETECLGDRLAANLAKPWKEFRAAVAFVKQSGTKHLKPGLQAFAKHGEIEFIVGVDHQGTSKEGLRDLLDAVGPKGRVLVFHNLLRSTFHPKVYLFKSENTAELIVGSGNLTEGGLFTNYEAALIATLDLKNKDSRAILKAAEDSLDQWTDSAGGTVRQLDNVLLAQLTAVGLVLPEAMISTKGDGVTPGGTGPGSSSPGPGTSSAASLFSAKSVRKPPSVAVPVAPSGLPSKPAKVSGAPPGLIPGKAPRGFVMTLQRTDVGVGQTTAGTSRRSPEIFIPLAARDANPPFWAWPGGFSPDPNWKGPTDQNGRGKMDRTGVRVRLGSLIVLANIWYNPDKRDIRIRSEALRSAGNVGDILRMEEAPAGSGFDYYVEIVPAGTALFLTYQTLCINTVRNSSKRFGYY